MQVKIGYDANGGRRHASWRGHENREGGTTMAISLYGADVTRCLQTLDAMSALPGMGSRITARAAAISKKWSRRAAFLICDVSVPRYIRWSFIPPVRSKPSKVVFCAWMMVLRTYLASAGRLLLVRIVRPTIAY
ncbi:MAG: hypothetical protein KGI68_08645 [Alphaproteobacteria bacterium]|nr:hypothetical protein [Alphaproteobacteria bacterium]MDE1986956.1 hypothetical protein [Alphaproteobacteria bacterium]MDE2162960.1 hypothetical protein [Alphaproteobacteria bacterium]MDE2265479.1 hypothetical protein [Alphaproteobacteria bacterium]